MDNLLTTTVEFFLIPEASLSTVFLVIFAIIFGVGVYWERNCRATLNELAENGERDFEAVREKMSPDLFIKKYLRKLSAAENKLEELPNVFVSVGIVATFLGLGVAIQGAAELLQTDKLELARLTAVLGVIAFKFQTSVWGICFSLIFRRLFVERYFEFRQEVIDELYDRLYSSERDSIRTLLERQNQFMSEHLAWQRTFEAEKISTRNAQHAALIAANNQLAEQILELEVNLREDNRAAYERIDYLATNFNRFVKAAEAFAANELIFAKTAENFSSRVEAFKVELTEFLHKEFAEIKAVNEEFSRLQTEHIEKIHSELESNILHITQQLDELHRKMYSDAEEIHSKYEADIFYVSQQLEELHRKFYLDAKRFAEETQQALDTMLGETIGKVHDEYSREAYEIRNVISDLNEALANIQGSVENINHEFTDEQKKFVDSWQIVFDRISDTMHEISSATSENASLLENSNKTLLDSAEVIRNASTETSDKLAEIVEANSAAFTASMRVVTAAQTNTAETVKNFTASFDESVDKIFSEFVAQSEKIAAGMSDLRAGLGDISQLSETQNSNTRKLLDKVISTVGEIQQGILNSVTENTKALTNRQEQIMLALNKITEKIPAQIESRIESAPQPPKVDTTKRESNMDARLKRFFGKQEKR